MPESIKRAVSALLVPLVALIVAFTLGALVMLLFGDDPLAAYRGLFDGAYGSAKAWSRTLLKTTPLILTGLAVAVAFKAGLFNIGAAGQFIMGTVCSVAVGIHFEGAPLLLHLPASLLAGIAGGMVWGAIPGLLKVYTGAHEVITTIMLNYIASLFASWTVYAGGRQGQSPGPLWDPTARAISETPDVLVSAQLPLLGNPRLDLHLGILIAPLVALIIWWLIYRTTFGFEVRTVGRNASAARYAGMYPRRTVILSMALAGGLAGLAGAIETLGLNHKFAPEFGGSVGFEGITVALLGQTHPLGVVLAAFLLGSLEAGASRMQFESGVAADIVDVIQALVLIFVAAPLIIRSFWRPFWPDRHDSSTTNSSATSASATSAKTQK